MGEKFQILYLLDIKKIKEFELDNIVHGTIEVRERNSNKYIYVHLREYGISYTEYVGEYSEVLYNVILSNNKKAKELKKEIKDIDKKLKELNYIDSDLNKEVEVNIDFAKKYLAGTIYKQAILEGVATTLLDTENIINGGKVNNMTAEDVMKIVNLKHSWDFILNKNILLSPSNYTVLCSINKLVIEGFYYSAGLLRSVPVSIGGTSWKPNIPIEVDVKEDINEIINSTDKDLDIAIKLLLYVVKKQLFIDGNKRTSVIYANHYLISKGKGLIVIPAEKVDEYKKLLIDYYENNNDKKIIKFLKDNCYLKLK